ncbi:hypothetical protein VI03_24610 [Burkholderia vietnamiensis]|uniref:hypothetical protein n=1 Tax=Burkholderia vietnamiensis TaxID=60552 RepID=UPI0006213AEF|nr:hypothetical protein [Burkholderia vietnamiensis]KKI35977.1 hypothetical protein VI03_24610 [Burkholderia vietnamiensis]HDR9174503.1 hypothetical protein [Burkholderia vietnamiensis]
MMQAYNTTSARVFAHTFATIEWQKAAQTHKPEPDVFVTRSQDGVFTISTEPLADGKLVYVVRPENADEKFDVEAFAALPRKTTIYRARDGHRSYTVQDFVDLCGGRVDVGHRLYSLCDWQLPEKLLELDLVKSSDDKSFPELFGERVSRQMFYEMVCAYEKRHNAGCTARLIGGETRWFVAGALIGISNGPIGRATQYHIV